MRYSSIELNGYKRMALNRADHFKMVITQPVQSVIGTNGSGKSSLLRELSFLPAVSNDFFKHGSKVIEGEHRGSHYVCKSVFQPSQRHSFIKDGVELNDGGTITVQKELVKTHIGLTKDVHDLMLGVEKFHKMSPSRRKEWFLLVCDTDYTYAIKIYNKLKERIRDTSGAIKLSRKRLVQETEKLIKTEDEEKIIKDIAELHTLLAHLQEIRKPIEDDNDSLITEQISIGNSITKNSNRVLQLTEFYSNSERLSEQAINKLIEEANSTLQNSRTLLEHFSKLHSVNKTKLDILQKAEKQSIQTLEEKIAFIHETIKNKSSGLLDIDEIIHCETALITFQSIKQNLNDIFINIPENNDKRYSQIKLLEKREYLNKLTMKKVVVIENIAKKKAKIDHMLEHKEKPNLKCPSCHHSFSIHYNETELNTFKEDITKLVESLENELDKEIEVTNLYIEQCLEYSRYYRQYFNYVQNHSVLNPYWNYLNERNVISDNPRYGVTLMDLFESDITKKREIETLLEERKKITELCDSLKNIGDSDLNVLIKTNEEIQASLELQTNTIQKSSAAIKEYTLLKSNINEIAKLNEKLKNDVSSLSDNARKQIETQRRASLNDVIRKFHSALGNKEHILNLSRVQKSIVENISIQILELEKDEISLGLLIKELSPTEGLIAEGLFGFIKGFIHQMNSFIKSVWSYPLEVKICNMVENTVELDYEFPLMVDTKDNVVNDVSKGSTGMTEIIDLAFRIIATRYLKMQDFPLYLDEFGASFDEAHRTYSINVTKALIEQQTFTQLFIISHYQSAYGALSNAEVCVLNELNITVPSSNLVNRHVTVS